MEFGDQKIVGKTSRRDVLKVGTALGVAALGLVSGLNPRQAWAASGIRVKVINSSGSFSQIQATLLKELKLFEKYGVDVESFYVADATRILAGLIGGDGDMCAAAGFSGLFPAIEKGAAIKILAGSSNSPLSIMYSSKPEIKSVKDLPGRTFGAAAVGALQYQMAVGVLKKYGVDYKTVKFVNVGSNSDIFKAVVAGTVDAGAGPIEFRNIAADYNLHPLIDGEFWKELPLFTNQAMYGSDRAIADNRKGIIGVMAAYADMFRWIEGPENKPAFLKYYLQALPSASAAEAAFFLDFISKPGRLATDLVLSQERIQYAQDLNVELGTQKAVLPFDRCTDMSLAKEATKLIRS